MKKQYLLLTLIALTITTTLQAQNDSIYFWKSGALLEKRSIKTADLDSITFRRPVANPVTTQVTICNQIWSTKNLDVTTYSDGTPIPQVTDPTAWANLTTGAWCYYNNDPANGAVYGKLYNWYAAAGIYDAASLANPTLRKKLVPTGWHVPTDAEWSMLINCLDPNANGGTTTNIAGDKMKSTTLWTPYSGIINTNSSGFTGLPGGYRFSLGTFSLIGNRGNWWSSSEDSTIYAWSRYLHCCGSTADRYSNVKALGFSVRCLRD
ncbi:MAG: hypothetical protein CFE24_05430 [Flavobacterium sp. BFFFF2]|nr:MAG: hypothetical protein CFE24_05430 [Flavobacterium sp. BFFFF2]